MASEAATIATALPPKPYKKPHKVEIGLVPGENRGTNPMHPPKVVVDNYYWMRDDKRERKEVIEHLEKENAYAAAATQHLNEFTDKLYEELKSHVKETDENVPYPKGDKYFYFSRTVEGKSYKLHCRKTTRDMGLEGATVFLDENEIAEGQAFCSVDDVEVSPSHKLVAYTVDLTGFETYDLIVKNIETGALLPDKIVGVVGAIWGADDRFIYYCKQDAAHRPYQLWRHELGTAVDTDELLFTEENELFWMGAGSTRSGKYIVVSTSSKETTECHLIDLSSENGRAKPVVFAPRTPGVKYTIDHHGRNFFIRTNLNGQKNFAVMTATEGATEMAGWRPVAKFPYVETRMIGRVFSFEKFTVVAGREGGMTRLWILDTVSPSDPANEVVVSSHQIEFAEAAHTALVSTNENFSSECVRLSYSSLVTPNSVVEYFPAEKKFDWRKETEVPHYDRRHYATERLLVKVRDGTLVPVSIVYRKDLKSDSPGPLMLYGYGSYGLSIDITFDHTRLPLLDRGMTFAIAHIRGGAEMGRSWYEDEGKYLTKKNTFFDFCDVAEYLAGSGWTTPKLQVCWGRSAGGLLIGATINLRPDLFRAAMAGVPFTDVLVTMSDPSIPLTVVEWEEWGNPNEEKFYDYIASYSPVNNVTPQAYPAILLTAGLNDPRVPYWEPAKFITHLRENNTGSEKLLFKCDLSAGHFSASDRYKYLKERAFDFSWLLDQFGLVKPPVPYPN